MFRPRARKRRIAAAASSTPLSRSMRDTSATVTMPPAGSGKGAKWSMSTPDPLIKAIRLGSIPSAMRAARSSGFCTTTQSRALPAASRSARLSGGRRSRAAAVVAVKPEPRPIIDATDAGV